MLEIKEINDVIRAVRENFKYETETMTLKRLWSKENVAHHHNRHKFSHVINY